MSLITMLGGRRGKSGFGMASTAEEVTEGIDLTGKTVLITGVNSGLGAESARVLASRGARIVGAARTIEKATSACRDYAEAFPVACELSEPSSVRSAVDAIQEADLKLDVIITNAGIMSLPKRTVHHGQEMQFLTNHIGHFILVTGLLDRLTPKGRVVALSSLAHRMAPKGGIQFDDISFEKNYDGNKAYGQSKLANLLFARALAKRLPAGQTANAVHPGVIATNLARHLPAIAQKSMHLLNSVAFKSVPEGAATQCYVATHPSLAQVTGEYFSHCNITKTSKPGRDDAIAEKLWARSEEIADALR